MDSTADPIETEESASRCFAKESVRVCFILQPDAASKSPRLYMRVRLYTYYAWGVFPKIAFFKNFQNAELA